MLKWNMTENFSLKVLICGFSLYVCFTSLKIVYHFFTVGVIFKVLISTISAFLKSHLIELIKIFSNDFVYPCKFSAKNHRTKFFVTSVRIFQ